MAMTLVSTVTVGSGGASSISWLNIPQTGKDLFLLISGRTTSSNTYNPIVANINNDGGLNYSFRQLFGTGSAASSNSGGLFGGAITELPGANATSSTFGNLSVYYPNYTGSTAKSYSVDGVTENNATAAFQGILAGNYTGTSAISSLYLYVYDTTNFAQHTTASLYIIS